jgi:hypothetical protein
MTRASASWAAAKMGWTETARAQEAGEPKPDDKKPDDKKPDDKGDKKPEPSPPDALQPVEALVASGIVQRTETQNGPLYTLVPASRG